MRLSKEIELLQEKNNQLTRQHNEDKQKDSEKVFQLLYQKDQSIYLVRLLDSQHAK